MSIEIADCERRLSEQYADGESWEQAIVRVGGFLRDLPSRWSGQRVLVIGRVATRWALDHYLDGTSLVELASADFGWREGWEYQLK